MLQDSHRATFRATGCFFYVYCLNNYLICASNEYGLYNICLAAYDKDCWGLQLVCFWGLCMQGVFEEHVCKEFDKHMCVCQMFEVCVSSGSWWILGRLSELPRHRAAGNNHMLIISSGKTENRAGQIHTALDRLGVLVCGSFWPTCYFLGQNPVNGL